MEKLLIIPLIRSKAWLRKLGYKKPIQNKVFSYGVKIINIGKVPFTGSKIKEIKLNSVSRSEDLMDTCEKEFSIKSLNPNESQIIWFEDSSLPFSGAIWLRFKVEKTSTKGEIETYQKPPGDKEMQKWAQMNEWGNTFIMKDESILQTQITNFLLIVLTAIVVITSIFF